MDPEAMREAMFQLRERYPDDDEFAAALERLRALTGEEGEGE